jgi:hypothetical protein
MNDFDLEPPADDRPWGAALLAASNPIDVPIEKVIGLSPSELASAEESHAKVQEVLRERVGGDDSGDDGSGGDYGGDKVLPVVALGRDLDRIVVETLTCLALVAVENSVFRRETELVRICARQPDPRQIALNAARATDEEAPRPKAFIERAAGAPCIVPHTDNSLERVLSRVVEFEKVVISKKGEPKTVRCGPSPKVISGVAQDGNWQRFPALIGLASSPIVRGDGTICQTSGYDVKTGYYVTIPDRWEPVAEWPTHSEAVLAASHIKQLLKQFQWETPSDFAAWLCLPLTMLCKAAIAGPSPIFAASANVRGAGKSRLVDIASIIVTGSAAPRATQPSNEAESGKVLTSIAMEADPLVLFDNLVRPFGDGKLDAWATGTVWQDRVLGVNKTIRAPIVTTLAITGNNITYHGDMTDRVLPFRLQSTFENPRSRTDFAIKDILEHVREHRCKLMHEFLTIVRAWYVAPEAERRPLERQWGSYEGWTTIIPQIVAWVGLDNPLDTRANIEDSDEADGALRALLAAWKPIEIRVVRNGMTCSELVESVYDGSGRVREGNESMAAALEVLATGVGQEKVNIKRLGIVMRQAKGRIIGGLKLVQPTKNGRWSVRP